MPEGLGDDRQEAEGELAVARIVLHDDDFGHAADHVAAALAMDPSSPGCYALLDELAARAGEGTSALFAGDDGGGTFIGAVAALAHLHARGGEYDQAVGLVAAMTRHQPGKPWAAAPWFGDPAVARQVDPRAVAQAVAGFAGLLPDPAPPELAAALEPYVGLARAIAARADADPTAVAVLSGLARRLGRVDEAVAWCERAEREAPGPMSAVMLGYALRAAGRRAEAIRAWELAVERDPANTAVYIDIADLCADADRLAEALTWLDRALAVDPDDASAGAARLAYGYRHGGDIELLVALTDRVRSTPGDPYLRRLLASACDGRTWLDSVPSPTDALANLLSRYLADQPQPGGVITGTVAIALSQPEAPSAVAALQAAMPNAELTIEAVPEPDIRSAPDDLRYRLWAYQGASAMACVGPPSEQAAAVVRAVASRVWSDPFAAYDQASGFAGLSLHDFLGLLVHPPAPPPGPPWDRLAARNPMYWPRFAQAWVCVGLLHHQADEPWEGSRRRAVLSDLLRGVEDWTVEAAGHALSVAAWVFPDVRKDVGRLLCDRYLGLARAADQRACESHDPFARVLLTTPGIPPQIQGLVHDTLARREGTADPDVSGPRPDADSVGP